MRLAFDSPGRRFGRSPYPVSAALAVGVAAAALLIPGTDVLSAQDPTGLSPGDGILRFVVVAAWAGAGLIIGWRRPAELLGSIALWGAVIGASTSLFDALANHGASPATATAARLGFGLLPAVAHHLLLALPEGRLETRSRRWLVAAGYAVGAVIGLLAPHDGATVSRWPIALGWLAAVSTGLVVSNGRYRRSNPVERRRMQWVGWALVVVTEMVLVLIALKLMTDWPTHLPRWALGTTVLIPVSITAGTHRGLMARVDRLITHTVSLAGLTALVIAFYVLVVVALGRSLNPGERSLLLLSMTAAALAALVYQPARTWLHDSANRLVYGETIAPEEALRTFGTRLTRAIPLDELLLQMVESLRKSMNLTAAECWTGANGRYDIAASVPHRTKPSLNLGEKELAVVSRAGVSGRTWLRVWLPSLLGSDDRASIRVAPMAHSGQLLGLIVVCRQEGDDFSAEHDRVLSELAREVGLALHNAQLDSALQASLEELQQANWQLVESRRRIVTAGDDERRRLERNLHDGAQQYLVAMAVKLRLAEDLLEEDPPGALELIGELRTNMQDAIGELRALAHGIFPPLLSSGGLAEALPAAVSRSALPAAFESGHTGRYDPEVEASVYFCCIEALQNAAKHAGAEATAMIRVAQIEGMLTFEVSDNGVGFATDGDDATIGGHGFVNMRDRLGAIGGQLTITSAPGRGTTVRGDVPVGPSPTPVLVSTEPTAAEPPVVSTVEDPVEPEFDRSEFDVDRLAEKPH